MYNKLSKSQNIIPNINLKQSMADLETIKEQIIISPKNKLSLSYIKKGSVKSFRNNLIQSKKNLTIKDFLFITFYIILSSLQLGIFLYGINLIKNDYPELNGNIIIFISLLFWKFLIYLLCFILIYFIFKSFLGENNNEIYNDYYPLSNDSENEDLSNFLTYFIHSSSIKICILNSFTLKNFLNDFLGIFSSFIIFYSINYLSFGIVTLIISLTNLIPFYINISKDNNFESNEFIFSKIISPFFIISGIISLCYSINNFFYNELFIFSFLFLIFCQIFNQKFYYTILKDQSPFNILFSRYLNYSIIIIIFFFFYFSLTFDFQYFYLFGLFLNWKIFTFCFIGFGILGFSFIFMTMMSSYILKNKISFKTFKHFEIVLNDLFEYIIFGRINIFFGFSYIFGIIECILAILIIDYNFELLKYFKPKKKLKLL